ncbi:Kunitz-type protease inhibitor, partial [Acinetobacter indicus]
FFLLALSTNPLLGAAHDVLDPVVDTAGEELKATASYYVLPPIWGPWGGGLGLGRNWNGSICPFHVVKSPSDLENGLPVNFLPISGEETVVRESTGIDIKFPGAPRICSDLPIWQISDSFVTLGGVGGSPIDRFRIEKHNIFPSLPSYKLVFCRARMTCQNIGIFTKNGISYLALSAEPIAVVFRNAQGSSEIKKITAGHYKIY